MEIPQKLEVELPYDPEIPLLNTHPKEIKYLYQKDTCTPMFIASLFPIAKTLYQIRWLS
jgi:hypothetical protein